MAEVRNEGNEETVVERVARVELPRLVREGHIDHALVLAGLHFLSLRDELSTG